MKFLYALIGILMFSSASFATTKCDKKASHAMDLAICTFHDELVAGSNPEFAQALQKLADQGYVSVNTSEGYNAVFVRGSYKDRYTYLIMTDVGSKDAFKSVGALISAKVSGEVGGREIRIEKVITSDDL